MVISHQCDSLAASPPIRKRRTRLKSARCSSGSTGKRRFHARRIKISEFKGYGIVFVKRPKYKTPFCELQNSSRGEWYSASKIGHVLEVNYATVFLSDHKRRGTWVSCDAHGKWPPESGIDQSLEKVSSIHQLRPNGVLGSRYSSVSGESYEIFGRSHP